MTDSEQSQPAASPYQAPDSEPARFGRCPDCSAEVTTDAQTCWMCGRILNAEDAEVVDATKPLPAGTFSLASLMILVSLVAVGLGLFVSAPGLGVLYCILLVPALVRTAVGVRKRAVAGQGLNFEDKFQLFATSMAVTVAACVAAIVAFFATCISTCFVYLAMNDNRSSSGESTFIFISFGLAGVLALAAFAGVFYLLRTRRRKK